MGLILVIVVHAANIQEPAGAKLVLERVKDRLPRLELIWAEGIHTGSLIDWAKMVCGRVLGIVKRPKGAKGFQVLPRRWVVERTFAWV